MKTLALSGPLVDLSIGQPVWVQDEDGIWMKGEVAGTHANDCTEEMWYHVAAYYTPRVPGKKAFRLWDVHRTNVFADPDDLMYLFSTFYTQGLDYSLFPEWPEEIKDKIEERTWKDSDPSYVPKDKFEVMAREIRDSHKRLADEMKELYGKDLL